MTRKSGIRASDCLSATPAFSGQRRLPEAQRRDPDCGSPFLWVLSFGEAKVKCLARRARPASPTQQRQLKTEHPFVIPNAAQQAIEEKAQSSIPAFARMTDRTLLFSSPDQPGNLPKTTRCSTSAPCGVGQHRHFRPRGVTTRLPLIYNTCSVKNQ
jgi:hypothetical protein